MQENAPATETKEVDQQPPGLAAGETVEGTLAASEVVSTEEPAEPNIAQHPTVPLTPLEPQKQYFKPNWWSMLAIALFLILLGEHTIPLVWPLVDNYIHPKAVVTLFPTQKQVRYQYTFLVVTGTPDMSHNQIPSRLISFTTTTRTETIKTTGVGYTPATQATGEIIFYNEAPYSQRIDAGTVITAGNGIQIVIDQSVTIAAGNGTTNGSAQVPAHTIQAGTRGNIPAYTINTLCCLSGILAKNTTAFSGGADPKPYPELSNADVKREAASSAGILHPVATEGIHQQIKLSEQLLQPIHCTVNSSSKPKIGERAITATVSVSENCNAQVFDNTILTQLTSSQFTQDSAKQLSSNFSQHGNLSTTIEKVLLLDRCHNTYQLMVNTSGVMIFHLSPTQVQRLKIEIAGKRIRDAQRELLQLMGVQGVYIQPSGQNDLTLPSDPEQILIRVSS